MVALLKASVEQGVTFFDTAEAYGPFANEKLLGEAFHNIRNEVVLATKFGMDIDPQTDAFRPGLNSRPEHIRAVTEASLARLKTSRMNSPTSPQPPQT
jgi:aryl-alcohol dehydrogenase-like predicted oxidoreductase